MENNNEMPEENKGNILVRVIKGALKLLVLIIKKAFDVGFGGHQ